MTTRVPCELSLRALQKWFLLVTTDPESAAAGIRRHAGFLAPCDLDRVVLPHRTETAVEQLDIYQRSYFSRLIECLADDYPALEFALGDEAFSALCRGYVVAHPSGEPNLNGFGRYLPCFIEERQDDLGRFALDLARLEWALVEVLHARAPEPLAAGALEAVPQSDLAGVRFVASPAVRLLSFEFPANRFLQAFIQGGEPSMPNREPSATVVVRSGYKIWRFDLGPAPLTLLRRLVAGEPLGSALEGTTARPEQIREWFQQWTAHGVFERVVTNAS